MTLSRLLCAFALTHLCVACDTHAIPPDPDPPEPTGGTRPGGRNRDDDPPGPDDGDERPESDEGDLRDRGAPTPDGPGVKVLGAARSEAVLSPTDATPSPDADHIYFLATSPSEAGRVASLHRSRPDGTGVRTLARGAPLSAPVGIAVSLDGETLLIADLSAVDGGAILRGPVDGAVLSVVAGTQGSTPRGVSVAEVDGREHVYFTGTVPDGGAGVYQLDLSGGEPELLWAGAPLVAPAGVAVSREGVVYVVDALADHGSAALLRIRDGEAEVLVGGLGVGFPAGLALTLAEDTALISGLSPTTGRDVVYVVDLASLELSHVTDPVDAFAEPAGLHRAHNEDVFAWADSEANDSGTVFILSL